MLSTACPKPEPRVKGRKAEKRQQEQLARELAKLIDARDRRRCRVCKAPADPAALDMTKRGERHHLVFRSKGGGDTSQNVLLLCAECHASVHAYRLKLSGDADLRDHMGKLAGVCVEKLSESGWTVERWV